MTTGTEMELATQSQRSMNALTPDRWAMIKEQAHALEVAGKGTQILPKGITNRAQISAILMAGEEIGLGPMTSLRSISLLNGRPLIETKALLGLVKHHFGADAIQLLEQDGQHCTVRFHRPPAEDLVLQWDVERAKQAKLWGKPGPWSEYPTNMLRWRCIAEGIDIMFPEVKLGLLTKEEVVGTVLAGGDAPGPLEIEVAETPQDESVVDAGYEPPRQAETGQRAEHAQSRNGVDAEVRVVPFARKDGTVVDMRTGVVLAPDDAPAVAYTQTQWNDAVALYAEQKHIDNMPDAYRAVCSGAGVRGKSSAWTPGEGGEYQTMIDWIAREIGYTPTPHETVVDEGDDANYGF